MRPELNRSGNKRGMHLYKHGQRFTSTYKLWCKIKERCHNPNAINYERYGGRGIGLCQRWMNFEGFFADMGERPLGMTIERINNSNGYEPGNVRWATSLEQANNRRNNVMVSFQGKSQSIADWCRELGLNYHLTRQRIYRNKWTPERAFQK